MNTTIERQPIQIAIKGKAEKALFSSQAERLSPQGIPDPLMGIIDGGTRKERYDKFTSDVLGKIWPESTLSGEYGDDFWRAKRWNRLGEVKEPLYDLNDKDNEHALSGYSHFSSTAVDLTNLSEAELETVVNKVGPDYLRQRSVPQEVTNPDSLEIVTGGSCVIETWGMRILAEMRKSVEVEATHSESSVNASEMLKETARRLTDQTPTISHASGGVLSGQDVTVHFVESDMWAERLEKDYGLSHEEARERTHKAYDRINDMVTRRAKLINPNTEVLTVNFDDMNIAEETDRWTTELGIPDNAHRVAEVMYTYKGDNQLDILKRAVEIQMEQLTHQVHSGEVAMTPSVLKKLQAMRRVLTADMQLRNKQIDHNRWGSVPLPKDVLVGQREETTEEIVKLDEDPAYKLGMTIMKHVFKRDIAGESTALVAGFADLPSYKGMVQHEDREAGIKFTGKPGEQEFYSSVETALTNRKRLRNGNVDQHLGFLQAFKSDTREQKAAWVQRKLELDKARSAFTSQLKEPEKKLSGATANVAKHEKAFGIATALSEVLQLEGVVPEVSPTQKKALHELVGNKQRAVDSLLKKQEKGDLLSPEDVNDLEELPVFITHIKALASGEPNVVLSSQEQTIVDTQRKKAFKEAEGIKVDSHHALERTAAEKAALEEQIATLKQNPEFVNLQKQIEEHQVGQEDLHYSYFPLSENPFVHHSMQFLFDSDFVAFLNESVKLQEERNTKTGDKNKDAQVKEGANERMRELMNKLYPKLESYINYLYGRSDYPDQMRNTHLFASQTESKNGHSDYANGHRNGHIDHMKQTSYNPKDSYSIND